MEISKEKRIVVPIWMFISSGGMRALSMLCNMIHQYGYEVVVVTYYKSEEPYFPITCPIQYVNKRGEIVPKSAYVKPKNIVEFNLDKIDRHVALKNALSRLAKYYNVVIANYHLTAFAVSQCKIKYKFYYIQAYEAWYSSHLSWVYNYFAKKSYSLDLIQIVNAYIYKDYREIKSEYVVPPGLDMKLYYPKPGEQYWNQNRTFVVGHIGRSEEWKGSNDVSAAVQILQNDGFNIKYVVAFNSPKEDSCNYELVKPDGDERLSEYYRSVDVLVAPGHIQLGAIHYPVIEAMACGTPVITTGYYPATDENAYIVGVKSPREIADAIKSIMSNYSLAMRKVEKAKQDIEAFSWDNVSKKMLRIIEEQIK